MLGGREARATSLRVLLLLLFRPHPGLVPALVRPFRQFAETHLIEQLGGGH